MDPTIAFTIRQGTVYYLAHRDLSSAEPHFFVVLNHNPRKDEVLLLAVASSKVEKVRKRTARQNLPKSTVVEISPADYSEFTKPSCINCNQLFEKTLLELSQARRQRELRVHGDLPPEILERLLQGCLDSPLLSAKQKEMIHNPESSKS